MRLKIYLGVLLAAFACLSLSAADAKKAPAKFEVQLLWGTDLPKSPDPTHKPVDAEVGRKLGSLPLRFKNYFVVNKHSVELKSGETKKVRVSQKCEVELKDLDNHKFSATFFGKGKQTAKRTQNFTRGEMLVHGGNAPGSNAWLVVVKRIQ